MKLLIGMIAATSLSLCAFAQDAPTAPDVNKVIEDLATVGPEALLSRVKELKTAEQALKDEVLDQIRRRELRPTRIQSLEDLLRVLINSEVDDHKLQEIPHNRFDGRGTSGCTAGLGCGGAIAVAVMVPVLS